MSLHSNWSFELLYSSSQQVSQGLKGYIFCSFPLFCKLGCVVSRGFFVCSFVWFSCENTQNNQNNQKSSTSVENLGAWEKIS